MKKLIRHFWWRLDPDKFPRWHIYKLKWWLKCRYEIDHIYFRIHGHWPVDKQGLVTTLEKPGTYELTP